MSGKELAKSNRYYLGLIGPLVDNGLTTRLKDRLVTIKIVAALSRKDSESDYLEIIDDSAGIKREDLFKMLSPAGADSLNGYWTRIVQAISELGILEYIVTKTSEDDKAIIVRSFEAGKADIEYVDVNFIHGTRIKIRNLSSIVPRSSQKYSQNIIGYLGLTYRRFLNDNDKVMKLSLEIRDIDDDKPRRPRPIFSVEPVYFHPDKRQNEPVINNHLLKGDDWEASVTYGYAPNKSQYRELGIEVPKHYMPYHVSEKNQGLDIVKDDKVIAFHQLSQIKLSSPSNDLTKYIRGEIDLISGFDKATAESILYDPKFEELVCQFNELLSERSCLEKKNCSSDIPEKLLKDRLTRLFRESNLLKKSTVYCEYLLEGLNGCIDILADEEAWNIKTGKASEVDVYQLFSYMDIGNFDKGYLVANVFESGAEKAAEFISEKYNKQIELVSLRELPINEPMSEEEFRSYCQRLK